MTQISPRDFCRGSAMAWGNFHKIVFYGWSAWPSYSYWMVPGTITDLDRI